MPGVVHRSTRWLPVLGVMLLATALFTAKALSARENPAYKAKVIAKNKDHFFQRITPFPGWCPGNLFESFVFPKIVLLRCWDPETNRAAAHALFINGLNSVLVPLKWGNSEKEFMDLIKTAAHHHGFDGLTKKTGFRPDVLDSVRDKICDRYFRPYAKKYLWGKNSQPFNELIRSYQIPYAFYPYEIRKSRSFEVAKLNAYEFIKAPEKIRESEFSIGCYVQKNNKIRWLDKISAIEQWETGEVVWITTNGEVFLNGKKTGKWSKLARFFNQYYLGTLIITQTNNEIVIFSMVYSRKTRGSSIVFIKLLTNGKIFARPIKPSALKGHDVLLGINPVLKSFVVTNTYVDKKTGKLCEYKIMFNPKVCRVEIRVTHGTNPEKFRTVYLPDSEKHSYQTKAFIIGRQLFWVTSHDITIAHFPNGFFDDLKE